MRDVKTRRWSTTLMLQTISEMRTADYCDADDCHSDDDHPPPAPAPERPRAAADPDLSAT
mgnify:CR=1 FL=1